jgi:ATP-binding cassette subfamily B protein
MKFKNFVIFLIDILKLRLKYFYFCLFLSAISSLLEFLSIGSIVPMLSSLLLLNTNTDTYFLSYIIKENKFLENNFLLLFVIFFSILTILAALIRIVITRFNAKLSALLGSDLSQIIFENTIKQPYETIISQNSNHLLTLIGNKVGLTTYVLQIFFSFLSSIIISIGIISFLIYYNFKFTFITILVVVIIYSFIGKFLKNRIKKYGKIISQVTFLRSKIIQETLPSIRDLILNSSHDIFVKRFKDLDFNFRMAESSLSYLNAITRPVLEGFGIVCLIILSYFLTFQPGESSINSNLIITIGVFAFSAQRLLPIFQNLYTCWSSIVGNHYILSDIKNAMQNKSVNNFNPINVNVNFKSQIEFKNIDFKYKSAKEKIFSNFNCKINFGKKTCILGKSGVGKTTFIDLLIGLLKPTSGKILIDGVTLDESNIKSWFSKIAYVPQDLVLIEDSIMKNVIYPNIEELINEERINDALRKAELSNFISTLQNKSKTILGEGGINLSGGQKQRLIIARAIYKQKQILVLDEATNALDNETEKNILDSVLSNNKNMTVIVITHRTSSLTKFDDIIDLNNLV